MKKNLNLKPWNREKISTIQGEVFVCLFIWVLRLVKILAFILSRVNRQVGRKQEIPGEKYLTTRKQNLACLTCDLNEARTHSGEMTRDLGC